MTSTAIGFAPDEIDTSASTRSARLKWVVVVDEALAPGRALNAAICTAAATGAAVAGLLGPDAVDAEGTAHPGLPWAGCTVLRASAEQLRAIRAKAVTSVDMHTVDMPVDAQLTRVYDEYLTVMSGKPAEQIEYGAVGIVGPRNRVDRIVGRLPLY